VIDDQRAHLAPRSHQLQPQLLTQRFKKNRFWRRVIRIGWPRTQGNDSGWKLQGEIKPSWQPGLIDNRLLYPELRIVNSAGKQPV